MAAFALALEQIQQVSCTKISKNTVKTRFELLTKAKYPQELLFKSSQPTYSQEAVDRVLACIADVQKEMRFIGDEQIKTENLEHELKARTASYEATALGSAREKLENNQEKRHGKLAAKSPKTPGSDDDETRSVASYSGTSMKKEEFYKAYMRSAEETSQRAVCRSRAQIDPSCDHIIEFGD